MYVLIKSVPLFHYYTCSGIFITNVLPDSRAHKSGLKPGYQILKINAFPLKESTHEEAVSLLTLKRAYILTCKDIGELLRYVMDELLAGLIHGRMRQLGWSGFNRTNFLKLVLLV